MKQETSDTCGTKHSSKKASKYRSGIGKMMHMMRWSRLDIYNMTHDCARHIMLAGRTHYDAMVCIMDYCIVLKLHEDWVGISTDHEFVVMIKIHFDNAKCPDTRRSVTESVVYLNGALVTFRSSTQKTVYWQQKQS